MVAGAGVFPAAGAGEGAAGEPLADGKAALGVPEDGAAAGTLGAAPDGVAAAAPLVAEGVARDADGGAGAADVAGAGVPVAGGGAAVDEAGEPSAAGVVG